MKRIKNHSGINISRGKGTKNNLQHFSTIFFPYWNIFFLDLDFLIFLKNHRFFMIFHSFLKKSKNLSPEKKILEKSKM